MTMLRSSVVAWWDFIQHRLSSLAVSVILVKSLQSLLAKIVNDYLD